MNKRQNLLTKLALKTPAALVGATVRMAATPESSIHERGVDPAAKRASYDSLSRRHSFVRDIVEAAFPFAEVVFRPEQDLVDVSASNPTKKLMSQSKSHLDVHHASRQSYLALPYVPHAWYHTVRDTPWYDSLRSHGGPAINQPPPLFPALPQRSGGGGAHDDARCRVSIGTDAIVFLGGYAPTDLSLRVIDKLTLAIPIDETVARRSRDAVKERHMLEEERVQAYLRRGAVAGLMKDKGCVLHNDVLLELSVPWRSRRRRTGGLNSTAVEDDETSERKSIFLTVGDPEAFPSQLNLIDRDEDRVLLRPAFGYSEYLLLQRLPTAMTGAARLLCRLFESKCVAGRAPPLCFWLSCVAHAWHATPEFASGEQSTSAEALVERAKQLAINSYDTVLVSWRWNFFLMSECFQSLPWWESIFCESSPLLASDS